MSTMEIAATAPPGSVDLFSPARLGKLGLRNRLAVAPMTRVSATQEGCATEQMVSYYRRFADGGFGLVITEGTYTDRAYSQGYFHQPGLTDDAQADAWRRVVQEVHSAGGRIVVQLMHAGALSQGNRFRRRTAAPSAVVPKGHQLTIYCGSGPFQTPVEMTEDDIAEVISGFERAARYASEVGFDGVEVHAANGYLLDQFLSSCTNRRGDPYGGNVCGRIRLTVEILRRIRATVGAAFTVGVRISQAKVNDGAYEWEDGVRDAQAIFTALAETGVDYIHTTEPHASSPAFRGEGPSLAALAKRIAGRPVIANGGLYLPEHARALLSAGDADIVALGRGALATPDWPNRLLAGRPVETFEPAMLWPLATLENSSRWETGRKV